LQNTLRKLSPLTLVLLAFIAAAMIMVSVAYAAARVIERRSEKVISARLSKEKIDWVQVDADGLQVHLTGTAPNEVARFRTVSLVGSIVDASRIRDDLEVTPTTAIQAPRFSVEMLRNDDWVQLTGLIPEDPGEGRIDGETLAAEATALATDTEIANVLDTAAYPAPETWDAALRFGIEALKLLKRSKISVAADKVVVKAIADSAAERRKLEADLNKLKPEGVLLSMDISAPRPVLTPFTLRFIMDENGARFDSCSADTERARSAILAVAQTVGVDGRVLCTVGLGVPTPRWSEAVIRGIKAVTELGAGSITFSDADVTLVAGDGTTQAAFDKVVGELENDLPDVFSLSSSMPKLEAVNQGPAEFTADLTPEGKVTLRGRLTDTTLRDAVDAFGRAAFGNESVYVATRLDPDLPDGWPIRVLAGLEALAQLHDGSLIVRADVVEVKGVTGSLDARAKITQILSDKLGQGQTFRVDVKYNEEFDPLAALPTPEECAAEVNEVVARTKITFTPASAEIAQDARPVIEALTKILIDCPPIAIEIGGYTDSQGSEGGNQALSQARAEAVLFALQGRRIDVSGFTAVGYGEANPIADNETEEGREANRRIEFVLKGVASAAAAGTDTPAGGRPDGGTETPEDAGPSFAPTEKTIRPKRRPEAG
jgi:OmpA-OmpF porin, OOP family